MSTKAKLNISYKLSSLLQKVNTEDVTENIEKFITETQFRFLQHLVEDEYTGK